MVKNGDQTNANISLISNNDLNQNDLKVNGVKLNDLKSNDFKANQNKVNPNEIKLNQNDLKLDQNHLKVHQNDLENNLSKTSINIESSPSKKTINSTTLKYREREQWSSKVEFILSCVAFSIGLGNVWRYKI